MNLSSVFGILAALGVLVSSVLMSSKSIRVFLDPHGLLIVLGGTAAAGVMCFPPRHYFQVVKVVTNKFLGYYATQYETVIYELVDLARGVRQSPDYLKQKLASLKNPFLKDAVELIVQGGIPEEALDSILIKRA